MKLVRLICTIMVLVGMATAHARTPEPSFPPSIEPASTEGQLNKLGEYRYVYRFFFKLYDVALYAPSGTRANDVLNAAVPFRLQFRYLREIDKLIILESSLKMLDRNLSDAEMEQIADRVDRINAAYTTVREDDRSALTFVPGSGTTLSINGDPIVTIDGDDFARLYFTIWLGDEPISGTLREAVLGLSANK